MAANTDIEGRVTYWLTPERGERSSGQCTLGADGSSTFATVRLNKRDSSVTYTVTSVARSTTSGLIL